MAFRVELSDRAQADITAIYDWLCSQQAGDAGERWFLALREAIASLSTLPSRCPVAPESREAPVEVRQLLYGRKPTSIEFSLLWTVTLCGYFTSVTAGVDRRSQP
jgi:plasmid stabilization system protein ParE